MDAAARAHRAKVVFFALDPVPQWRSTEKGTRGTRISGQVSKARWPFQVRSLAGSWMQRQPVQLVDPTTIAAPERRPSVPRVPVPPGTLPHLQ